MYEDIVRKVPMFAATDANFIRALVRLLKPQVLLEGDYAFRYGEVGDTMFFVQSGLVQIGNEGFSTVYAALGQGKYFGELALFTAQRRTASARAGMDCTLYVPHRQSRHTHAAPRCRRPDAVAPMPSLRC